jgi:hypothetical protein
MITPDLTKPCFQLDARAKMDVENGNCPICAEKIEECNFSSELSKKEYSISGMCENCQNEIFDFSEIED